MSNQQKDPKEPIGTYSSRAATLMVPDGDWKGPLADSLAFARTQTGHVAIRHAGDPEGPALLAQQHEFDALAQAIKNGDLDEFLSSTV